MSFSSAIVAFFDKSKTEVDTAITDVRNEISQPSFGDVKLLVLIALGAFLTYDAINHIFSESSLRILATVAILFISIHGLVQLVTVVFNGLIKLKELYVSVVPTPPAGTVVPPAVPATGTPIVLK